MMFIFVVYVYDIGPFFTISRFDLEFDIDLEIKTIFKSITKEFKHTLQK